MSLLPSRVLDATVRTALGSEGVGRNRNYKVGASLLRDGTILRSASNTYKTHPILAKWTPYPHLHAETRCLIHQGLDKCADLDILVVRVLADGSPTMAKPCAVCTALLQYCKIDRIFYTDWNGEIQCL